MVTAIDIVKLFERPLSLFLIKYMITAANHTLKLKDHLLYMCITRDQSENIDYLSLVDKIPGR